MLCLISSVFGHREPKLAKGTQKALELPRTNNLTVLSSVPEGKRDRHRQLLECMCERSIHIHFNTYIYIDRHVYIFTWDVSGVEHNKYLCQTRNFTSISSFVRVARASERGKRYCEGACQ